MKCSCINLRKEQIKNMNEICDGYRHRSRHVKLQIILDLKPVYTTKVFVNSLSNVFDGKFAQRILCQSYPIYTIKVVLPSYLSVVNSDSEMMF